jgi:hypothetical protein
MLGEVPPTPMGWFAWKWFKLRLWRIRLRERLLWRIAEALPDSVTYLAAIRVWANATGSKYGSEDVTGVTCSTAIGRWEKK